MDVTEMLKQAEADMKEAEAASVAAQARADAAQADAAAARERAKEMRAVLQWLRLRSQSAQPTTPVGRPGQVPTFPATHLDRSASEMSQTDLCLQALESFGRAATTTEIREHLVREGHQFTQNQVRATLKYLARKSPPPVETTSGSGLWRIIRHSSEAAPFPGGIPVTGTLAMNGARGEP